MSGDGSAMVGYFFMGAGDLLGMAGLGGDLTVLRIE